MLLCFLLIAHPEVSHLSLSLSLCNKWSSGWIIQIRHLKNVSALINTMDSLRLETIKRGKPLPLAHPKWKSCIRAHNIMWWYSIAVFLACSAASSWPINHDHNFRFTNLRTILLQSLLSTTSTRFMSLNLPHKWLLMFSEGVVKWCKSHRS